MTEEGLRTVLAWFFGGGLMALGAMFALANTHRHWEMYRRNKAGEFRRISGTPLATSLFFFAGWWIAPPGFTPWILLVLLAELPAFITIIPSDGEAGLGGDEGSHAREDQDEEAAGLPENGSDTREPSGPAG